MFNPFSNPKAILGINARNLEYIRSNNSKESKIIADSKLKTKRLLKNVGIPVMDTYAIIRSPKELASFDWNSLPKSFVIKPNKGLGGNGIIIIFGEKKIKKEGEERVWLASNGQQYSISDLTNHVINIIDGSFSLRHSPDSAIFEQRVRNIPLFKEYIYKGVPDVRVVVYNRIPIMAELRLPTKISNGKANLHSGGVGIGIDIGTGTTTSAIQFDKLIDVHPDSKKVLSGIKLPHWNKVLDIAIESQIVSGLGYVGVDIAYDKERGPVVLELNARPGLAIQIANQEGLGIRLNRTKGLKVKTKERGIAIAKGLFGGEIEEEIEEISGKQVLGRVEEVKIFGRNKKEELLKAKIDTGAFTSSLDIAVASRIGYNDIIKFFESLNIPQNLTREEAKKIAQDYNQRLEEYPYIKYFNVVASSHGVSVRPVIEIPVRISGEIINMQVNLIDRSQLTYSLIIGRRDLGDFLVDVTKTYKS